MICAEGQGFAENLNDSYAAAGLKGHTGLDESCGFGTPIHSPFEGYVYKVLTKDVPAADGSGFTGVFMLVDDGVECFEWLVGHCDPSVSVGAYIKKGDLLGKEANHGLVYAGNVRITLAMQAAGDQRGHHRHYQKRPVRKVMRVTWGMQYLTGMNGGPYRDQMGFLCECSIMGMALMGLSTLRCPSYSATYGTEPRVRCLRPTAIFEKSRPVYDRRHRVLRYDHRKRCNGVPAHTAYIARFGIRRSSH